MKLKRACLTFATLFLILFSATLTIPVFAQEEPPEEPPEEPEQPEPEQPGPLEVGGPIWVQGWFIMMMGTVAAAVVVILILLRRRGVLGKSV